MYIQLIPTTLDDIRLDGKWTETVTEDRFLLFDDSEQTQNDSLSHVRQFYKYLNCRHILL